MEEHTICVYFHAYDGQTPAYEILAFALIFGSIISMDESRESICFHNLQQMVSSMTTESLIDTKSMQV